MRLATFNILNGRSTKDGTVRLDRLAGAVRSLDADILGLQEVDRLQERSHRADLTAVAAEAMGARAHRFTAALTGTAGATWVAATGAETPDGASYGIALLSRYPVVHWQVLRLPRIPVRIPMWLPGPRKVIVVHDEPRTVVIGTFRTPFGDLAVANTHLSFVPGWGAHQLRRVIHDLAVFPEPLVLMGDLNMVTPAAARRAGYRSLARHDTFPVVEPDRQLDHILVRGRLGRVTSSRAQLLTLSDHRALVVDLSDDQTSGSVGR